MRRLAVAFVTLLLVPVAVSAAPASQQRAAAQTIQPCVVAGILNLIERPSASGR